MTDSPAGRPVSRGFSTTALVLGLLSVVLVIVFVFTPAGATPLVGGIVVGLAAIVIGIIALAQRQPKAPALIGLIVGSIVFLLGAAMVLFALLFVGAIPLAMGE